MSPSSTKPGTSKPEPSQGLSATVDALAEAIRERAALLLFPVAALLLLVVGIGLVVGLVVGLVWHRELEFSWLTQRSQWCFFAMILGIACGIVAWLRAGEMPKGASAAWVSEQYYRRHNLGLTFALLYVAVLCAVIVAGLYHIRIIGDGRGGSTTTEGAPAASQPAGFIASENVPYVLLLSALLAILGAMFFVSDSLRRKVRRAEPFSGTAFWGGLWFRLGQAVIYTLLLFWFAWKFGSVSNEKQDGFALDYTWLPLMSLMCGMFVKSGEKLFSSIAIRIFQAVSAFFGEATAPNMPAAPAGQKLPRVETLLLSDVVSDRFSDGTGPQDGLVEPPLTKRSPPPEREPDVKT